MFQISRRHWNLLPSKAKHTNGNQKFILFFDLTKGQNTEGQWLEVEVVN